MHCRPHRDHVVFRVSEASDPSDSGFFFLFSGAFDTYAGFARRLGQLQTPEARWIRALRPYGLTVHTWESVALNRAEGAAFWYVQLHADVVRAQLHYASVQVTEASFHQVAIPPVPRRPVPVTTKATQTLSGPGGFPHEVTVWQTPQHPTHCEPGLFPEISSTLADVWCDAWHIKCLIPCIPEFHAWVLRDGSRLIGLCTVDITWDHVSQALHISSWELPQTFVHGDGLLIPYPAPLHNAKDRCLSVSHDTPEAVACLSDRRNPPLEPGRAGRPFGGLIWLLGSLCIRGWHACWLGTTLLLLPGAMSVRLDEVIADAADDPSPEPLPFRDYIDLTRTCTMSWTHELSRQALGFSVRAQILGEHIQRIAPAPEVLLLLWKPGRSPTLLQVRPRRLALHLSGFLRALGYSEGVDSLHIAYDTSPHALDLIAVPPTGGTWWIVQDHSGREVLRPVTRHYTSSVHFRLLTVSPDRHAQTVCPAYGVQQQPLLPQGARGRVIRDLPELHGSLCQGILSFALAAGFRRGSSPLFWVLAPFVYGIGVSGVVVPNASANRDTELVVAPHPQPHTLSVSSHPYLCLLVGFLLTVRSGAPPMGYPLWLLVSLEGVSGSYFTPNASESGDEESHTEAVPDGHRPGGGPHSRPAGPPPPTPAGMSDAHDPADARLVYNETAPPDLNFLPGSMRSVHVTRRFPAAMIVRWVQNRLIRHQHGMLPATAFLNGPIPQGTPFRFHNPFTSRAQCHEVGYQEPEHIPPLGVLQAHADNRGWRGVVLLNPQPDSAAVHLIALPQHGHLASVALLVNNRVVPCCVPRRARWRELRSIAFEGVRGRLDLPSHIDVVQDTVTFRSGDCFRIDTADDRTAASEYALLEEVDSENAEPSFQPATVDVSGSRQLGPVYGVLLGLLLPLARQPRSWFLTFGLASALAMHRPGGFPWSVPQHERVFPSP